MITDNKPIIQFGWLRVLLYTLLSLLLVFGFSLIIGAIVFASGTSEAVSNEDKSLLSFIGYYFVVTLVLIGLAFLFRRLVDKQSIISMGFAWKNYGNNAAAGFFLAILLLCFGSVILVMLQFLFFTSIDLNIRNLLYSILLFTLVAFTEEIAFRGYILNNLLQSTNKWLALALSALLFALFHSSNDSVSAMALLNIFVAGLLLGINYIFTKNLWFAILLHFSWNFFQGPILGFEVSGMTTSGLFQQTLKGPDLATGGDFGFEGSIICLVINAITCILLAFYYTRKKPMPQAI
jgi:uncharacterized protein